QPRRGLGRGVPPPTATVPALLGRPGRGVVRSRRRVVAPLLLGGARVSDTAVLARWGWCGVPAVRCRHLTSGPRIKSSRGGGLRRTGGKTRVGATRIHVRRSRG